MSAPRTKTWTCPKRSCRTVNISPKRTCRVCGTAKKTRRPKHLVALELPYETYIGINGGEHCGVCRARRKEGGRRLDRDHDHRTGKPRGLLCHRCNRKLDSVTTPEWLRAAAAYLERTKEPKTWAYYARGLFEEKAA